MAADVGEAHTIQYADLGAHTLKALPAGPAAGNQVVCLARVRALPQTVQRSRRRRLRLDALLDLLRRGRVDTDGHRVDGSVFDGAQAPERPGQQQVQAGAQHGDRRAEAFVDATLPEIDQLQPRQNPAQQRRPQHGRQNGRAQKPESPTARKVQSEVSLQQRAGRARTACDDGSKQALGDCRSVRRRRRRKNIRASARMDNSEAINPGTQISTRAGRAPRRALHLAELDGAGGHKQRVVSNSTRRNAGASGSCGAGKARMTRSVTRDMNASAKTNAAASWRWSPNRVARRRIALGRGFRPRKSHHEPDQQRTHRYDERLADPSGKPRIIPRTWPPRGGAAFRESEARPSQRQRAQKHGER